MRLKHIELKGFKSFAKKERLDFEKRLTAIVGPNGSGKSNIAEAFRFVLGEQSMKSMRSKRTEDLLFNGSATLPRTNRASVSLTFDNTDRNIKHAFDEIEIERIIHRDATNEYYINGSPARLKDIVELLSEAKIGTAGHHIISQGEADRLLSMSTRERKSHIEEALGLTQYQLKKTEAEKKLEKTYSNLESIKSLRRENAPHLQYLEREMKLIEKRREIIAELDGRGREYAKKFVTFLKLSFEHNKNEEKILFAKIEEAEENINKGRNAINPYTHDSALDQLRDKLSKIDRDLEELRVEKSTLAHSMGKLETELEFISDRESAPTTRNSLDAQSKLEEVRTILKKAKDDSDVLELKELIDSALEIIDESPREVIAQKEDRETLDLIEVTKSKLEALASRSNDLSLSESELINKKTEIDRAIDVKQREKEDERVQAERSIYEKRALDAKLESTTRELETLKTEEGRFYASLEEIALISGLHFSKEDLAPDPHTNKILREEISDLDREVERLKLKIESLPVGNSNEVERAYLEAKERSEFLDREIQDLETATSKLQNIIDELGQKIESEFSSGLGKISEYFTRYFSHMFKGGSAELKLVEIAQRTDEEEKEKVLGVDVKVSMPHKRLKSTAMLSGGEKTLVSIALIFALSQVNPPPFLILDETDAALDEANSRRYGEALRELSKHSQLILITHNRETMSYAGMLYGITMGKSATSELLSIDLEEAEKIAR